MSTLNVGALGTADILVKNSRAMREAGLHLVALGSRSIDAAQHFIDDHGIQNCKAFGSYDEVINDPDVQAVYIPLPSNLHLEWVKKCAEAKKHILLEKPISMTKEDAEQIINTAKQHNIVLMDGTMWMHNPRTCAMEKILYCEDTFGKVQNVKSYLAFHGGENFWRDNIRVKKDLDGLGCLGDVGWYCIRASLWANHFEMPQKVKSCPGSEFYHKETDCISEGIPKKLGACLYWNDGRTASFECSFTEEHLKQHLEIIGTKGHLLCKDPFFPENSRLTHFEVFPDAKNIGTVSGKSSDTHTTRSDHSQETLMWKNFNKMVHEGHGCGQEPCEHWMEMSLKTQLVTCAIMDSLRKCGEEITL